MVYLIHFHKSLSHANHYIGYSKDELFDKRIECHKNNRGACILTALNKKRITWEVAREWPNEDGNFERKLKNKKNAKLLCPICIEVNKKK